MGEFLTTIFSGQNLALLGAGLAAALGAKRHKVSAGV